MSIVPDRYRFATRLNSFRDRGLDRDATAPDLLRAVASVSGLTAVELNYPQHFQGTTEGALSEALAETGLALTALSLRFEGSHFLYVSFTTPRTENRERAIQLALEA